MVKGLEIFKNNFEDHLDKFVIIGGAACFVSMENAGLPFRSTKDLDIVLLVETADIPFIKKLRRFINEGRYQNKEKESGKRQHYRFSMPENKEYPYMLEFFSRKPDHLDIEDDQEIIPVLSDNAASSLSAILLDDFYYQYIKSGTKIISGIPIVIPEHLIPLKAKAFLDLTERKERGEKIDSRDIVKHKNDVFRLANIIDPAYRTDTARNIVNDMSVFIEKIRKEPVDLKSLGIKGTKLESVLEMLKNIYLN